MPPFGPFIKTAVFDAINFFPNDPLRPPNPIRPGPEIHAAVRLIVDQTDLGGDGLLGVAPPTDLG